MSERFDLIKQWLQDVFPGQECILETASEDASFRSYYRLSLEKESQSYIVMDAPPEHEDIRQFLEITQKLACAKVNVPEIFHQNLEQGFLVLSDFGDVLYLDRLDNKSVDSLYKDAITALVKIQVQADKTDLPKYEEALLKNEMNLFNEWLLNRHLSLDLSSPLSGELRKIYSILINNALEQNQVFVHRDYHSRNLMSTDESNPGIIDYQDAVLGPISYDLVSLLKDCYIKWSREEVCSWVGSYVSLMNDSRSEIHLEPDQFLHWFDLMGVQRHLKASGIFARLYHRDGKSGYLKDIPRTLSYITDLKDDYPELSTLVCLIEDTILPGMEIEK